MNRLLLFGAGKSATCLIDYLLTVSANHGWELTVADGNPELAKTKIGSSPHGKAVLLNVEHAEERAPLIQQADVVISLLPPALHFLIAKDCIRFRKNLLTASYVDDRIAALRPDIEKNKLLFLCEMGLDPGIDHMSAMEIIQRIRSAGGKINSFKSHTGGLVAPESDNNPWHYKISWNPRNVVLAGRGGAIFKEKKQIRELSYEKLFDNCPVIQVDGIPELAWYPNRDSLSYIPIYGLQEADTFSPTTLRYPGFCRQWKWIVRAGLADDQLTIDPRGLQFKQWSGPILPYLDDENTPMFRFLGFLDDEPVPQDARTSADILQYLLETRLNMQPEDRDMIVMLHEFEYELGGQHHALSSSLLVKGENNIRTAMAKTVGLPLGIAARLILSGKIKLTGLHIPILPEIYLPVMDESTQQGIRFVEKIS